MKLLSTILLLFTLSHSYAHENHGEVSEGGKFGGVMSPIVDHSQAGLGTKAKTLYKAELVRAESGKLSLYVFDEKMNVQDLAIFDQDVEAKLEVKKKGKFIYFGTFKLSKHGNHFMGQLPKVEHKPFNIDLTVMKGKQKLFVGFANLD